MSSSCHSSSASSFNTSCTYRFISSSLNKHLPRERDYNLKLRQQPRLTKVCSLNDRDRRQAIDPPPILKLEWMHCAQNITRYSSTTHRHV
ncbi:hypothetical protein K492DRAFT_177809, partial [Lichtheimia hyalospora FSU 10163]